MDCDLTASIVSPFGGDRMTFYWSSSARRDVTGSVRLHRLGSGMDGTAIGEGGQNDVNCSQH